MQATAAAGTPAVTTPAAVSTPTTTPAAPAAPAAPTAALTKAEAKTAAKKKATKPAAKKPTVAATNKKARELANAPKRDRSKQGAGIVHRGNSYRIDPRAIDRRPGWNPRFDFGDIPQLAESIKAQGVLMPLRVVRKGDRFELIDGDRRLTAIEKLMKDGAKFPEGVPAIIETAGQSDADLTIRMILANEGKPFLPLEEAAAYKRLRDSGMTIKQLCEKVGRVSRHVTQMLALVEADDSVKDAVKDGKIGKQVAKDIATKAKGDKGKQKELTEKAIDAKKDKVKRRALNQEVAAISRKAKKKRTRKALNVCVSIDALRTFETSVLGRLRGLMKEMGFKDNTEITLKAKSEKVCYLTGLQIGLVLGQQTSDEKAQEMLKKVFADHTL